MTNSKLFSTNGQTLDHHLKLLPYVDEMKLRDHLCNKLGINRNRLRNVVKQRIKLTQLESEVMQTIFSDPIETLNLLT